MPGRQRGCASGQGLCMCVLVNPESVVCVPALVTSHLPASPMGRAPLKEHEALEACQEQPNYHFCSLLS